MSTARKPLYERLPEIYRQRDAELTPPGQLRGLVDAIDSVMTAVHDDIESLYHNLFIETCDDWVIPYIADLLGTSHLAGDPWTLRTDAARTIKHRRRKGTLGAMESLAKSLTGWAAHAVEMRERLAWQQHLNHQRPERGGTPPLGLVQSAAAPVHGGTVNLRSPAVASLLGSAFDPYAYVADVKPSGLFNLPNLALFLWRLAPYKVPASQPVSVGGVISLSPANPGQAKFAVRFNLDPLARPMVLFNTYRYRADAEPPDLSVLDAVPGPILSARITEGVPDAHPEQYIDLAYYSAGTAPQADESVGLTLHLPDTAALTGIKWRFRGANLCAWEAGLSRPLGLYEIVVDPERGRVVFGTLANANEAKRILNGLRVSATHGFSGPDGIGARPVNRRFEEWQVAPIEVNYHLDPDGLTKALANLPTAAGSTVIEINDSMTHDLDLGQVTAIGDESGLKVLRLGHSLWIRAASGQRPVIRLSRPLAFRADKVSGVPALEQESLEVRLEGLFIARAAGFNGTALIERAAVGVLALQETTLDPGGHLDFDGTRAPFVTAMQLTNDYGFANATEEEDFEPTPTLTVARSILGPLRIDSDYRLTLADAIVDAGGGLLETPRLALCAATGDPEKAWGPALIVRGLTAFGRMRVFSATGQGGMWAQQLQVHDTLSGCIKFSYFEGRDDRLPQHHGCVTGKEARLAFTSEIHGRPGYGQLTDGCDQRILEQGPNADEMGAFGYLFNSHKRKNLGIRLREYLPVGVAARLIYLT